MRLYTYALAAACLSAASPAFADIALRNETEGVHGRVATAIITGEIGSADAEEFVRFIEYAKDSDQHLVILDTKGGDVDAAMRIGHAVRAAGYTAVVPSRARCHSSCVLILGAGVDRKAEGSIGIHRPYFPERPSGDTAIAVRKMKVSMEAYAEEMNLPQRLIEDMFSTAPADMRILTPSEMRDYRLSGADYIADEERVLNMSENLGVSRETYELFRQELNRDCMAAMGSKDEFSACVRDIAERHGVPVPPMFQK